MMKAVQLLLAFPILLIAAGCQANSEAGVATMNSEETSAEMEVMNTMVGL